VTRAQRVPFEVPAHLDKPAAEPAVDVETLRTKGDLMVVLGNVTTWGRTVWAQYGELRRLLDVFNEQAGVPRPPNRQFGGPK
jgi:hypothetical protein